MTRMGTGPMIHNTGDFVLSYDWSGEQARPCSSTMHSTHTVLMLAHVMRGNVTRIKAHLCCRIMHSMHAVLMSVHAEWGEMQRCIVLKGGIVRLPSLYYLLLFVTM